MVQGVPVSRRHGQEFPKSSPVSQAVDTARAMEKIAEELERARQRLAIRSQPVACEFEVEDR